MMENDIVISGMAGRFPESDGVQEFEKNLFDHVNMITDDERKWLKGELGVPHPTGKTKKDVITSFDSTFFGIHTKLCFIMDPHTRLSLERSYEAMIDAGYNPAELAGTKTGVFMSSMTSETEYAGVMVTKGYGHAMLGHSRSMQANRISYFFDLKGPSFVVDSTWGGGFANLEIATHMLREGLIDYAVVGSCSLLYTSEVSTHYYGMRKLSPDGTTRSFCSDAEGYGRSEACVILLLQRGKDARRSYGSVLDVKYLVDGFRNCSFPTLSPYGLEEILNQIYFTNKDLSFDQVAYLEADGTSIKEVDALELNAIDKVLCQSRKNPLLIGSVKTNAGHAEAAAGFVSLVKALLVLKTGQIPASLNFSTTNENIPGFKKGLFKVVCDNTPLPGDTVAVNCWGLSGGMGHAVIKQNPKQKTRVLGKGELPPDGLPRLLILAGRNEEGTIQSLKQIEEQPIDEELISLTHHIFRINEEKFTFKGYTILDGTDSHVRETKRNVSKNTKPPVWFVFSGMGSQWNKMGTTLMEVPIIAESIQRSHKVLEPKGVDLIHIITTEDPSIYDSILHAFVGIAAIQIALVDVLRALGVEPDGIVGHSVGELGCSYADDCLTAEQVILAAYARGKASIDTKLIKGMMAAVGMGYKEIKDKLPEGIEVACHNSPTSCTLSGPTEVMAQFVDELKATGVFARLVNVANIAYHSKHIAPAAPALLRYLKEVIPDPKPRSSKWISSSVPEDQWDTDLAKTCSAEYHTNNLLSYVLFEEASAHIPKDAVCIEIAPHGLLQAILKRSLTTCTHIPLTNRNEPNGIKFLLQALGKIYLSGSDLDLTKLYPPVQFPVSRETPHLDTLIKWNHEEYWDTNYILHALKKGGDNDIVGCVKKLTVGTSELNYDLYAQYLFGHQNIVPPSAYMAKAISTLTDRPKPKAEITTILQLKDVWSKDVVIPGKKDYEMLFQPGSGYYEFVDLEEVLATGYVKYYEGTLDEFKEPEDVSSSDGGSYVLSQENIYHALKNYGLDLGQSYQTITEAKFSGPEMTFTLQWEGSMEVFIESLFIAVSLYHSLEEGTLMTVREAYEILINIAKFTPEIRTDVKLVYNAFTGVVNGDGVRALNFKCCKANLPELEVTMSIGKARFLPNKNPAIKNTDELFPILAQFIEENIDGPSVLIFGTNENKALMKGLEKAFNDFTNLFVKSKSSLGSTVTKDVILSVSTNALPTLSTDLLDQVSQSFILIYLEPGHSVVVNHGMESIFENVSPQGTIQLYMRKRPVATDVEVIDIGSSSWEKRLVETGKKNKSIIISGQINSIGEVYQIIRKCSSLADNKLLRYFLVDKTGPKLNFKDEAILQQMKKNLKYNIFIKKAWGSVQHTMSNLKDVSSKYPDKPSPIMDNIKADNIKLEYVSPNLEDILGAADPGNNKVEVLEYVGVDSEGDSVFGLGQLNDQNELKPDPHYVWKCPGKFRKFEMATIPLSYAIACYALDVYREAKKTDVVLIHGGHFPAAHAAITVALSKGCQVVTTVQTEEQKAVVLNKFPQLDRDNVLLDKSFYNMVMLKVDGKGVNFILNYYGKFINESLACAAHYCIYVQIGSYVPSNEREPAGMGYFLKESKMFGAHPKTLFNLQDRFKVQIHDSVQRALDSGVIEPLDCKTTGGDYDGEIAALEVKQMNKQVSPKKIVISLGAPKGKEQDHVRKATYECNGDKTQIIFGGESEIWFETTKWIIARGAKHVIVVINKENTKSYLFSRLKRLLSRHNTVSVTILDPENFSTKQKIEDTLIDIGSEHPVGDVFYFVAEKLDDSQEKTMERIESVINEYSTDSQFICIGEGGEKLSERRMKDGYKGFTITLKRAINKQNSLLNSLDKLLGNEYKHTSPVLTVWESRISLDSQVVEDLESLSLMFCPDTLQEVIDVLKNASPTEKPTFLEMPTRAQRLRYLRDTAPVYVFPGFKVKLLETLLSKLYYPALKAVLPSTISDIAKVSQALAEQITRPDQLVTMIAEGVGASYAFEVAKILEGQGKKVEIIFLDTSPKYATLWSHCILNTDTLLSRFHKLSATETKELSGLSNWNDKSAYIVDKVYTNGFSKKEVQKGLELLGVRLIEAAESQIKPTKLAIKCHLFRPSIYSKIDGIGLQEISTYPLDIHLSEDDTFQNMMENGDLLDKLNLLPMYNFYQNGYGPDELKNAVVLEFDDNKAMKL